MSATNPTAMEMIDGAYRCRESHIDCLIETGRALVAIAMQRRGDFELSDAARLLEKHMNYIAAWQPEWDTRAYHFGGNNE